MSPLYLLHSKKYPWHTLLLTITFYFLVFTSDPCCWILPCHCITILHIRQNSWIQKLRSLANNDSPCFYLVFLLSAHPSQSQTKAKGWHTHSRVCVCAYVNMHIRIRECTLVFWLVYSPSWKSSHLTPHSRTDRKKCFYHITLKCA